MGVVIPHVSLEFPHPFQEFHDTIRQWCIVVHMMHLSSLGTHQDAAVHLHYTIITHITQQKC